MPANQINSRYRIILLNVISNYVGKLISFGAWFLITPFMLSQLQKDLYGLWVLVGSLVAYGTLLDLGIAGAVTKYVAEYRAKNNSDETCCLVSTAFAVYCTLGMIVIVISVLLAFFFPAIFSVPPENYTLASWLVFISGIGVGISIPCNTTYAILRGYQRFDLVNFIYVIKTLLSISLFIGVLLLDGGVIGITLVSVVVTLLMQIPAIVFIQRIAPDLRIKWHHINRRLFRTVAKFSTSIFLINLGGQLEYNTDEVVIGVFLPVNAVTPYNLARRLSTLPQVLTDQFLSLLLPMASAMNAINDKNGLRQLYLTSSRLTLAVFLPICTLLFILAGPILLVWVGDEYFKYAYLVRILVIASLIDTSIWPAGLILQGMARHRFLAFIALLTGVANLLLSILLVRELGLIGIALGTLIPTMAVCLIFVLPYAMRNINVNFSQLLMQVFVPTLIPLIPMILITYSLSSLLPPLTVWSTFVASGSGVLAYLISYLRMNACDLERQVIYRIARRSLNLMSFSFFRN